MSESVAAAPAAIESPSSPEIENESVAESGAEKAPAAPTPAEKAKIEKFLLKVDGKEEEMELDLDNKEELKKQLQLARVAQKRMQQHSSLQKDVDQLINLLKTNPQKILSDPRIGIDIKKFAQDIINNEIDEMQKSPEQKEKEKLQKELEDLKSQKKKDEDDRKAEELERYQSQIAEQLNTEIISALDAGSVPKTPYTVSKMADLMLLALNHNVDLQPKDLVPLMKKNMMADIKELFGASPDDVVEEFLGKDRLNSIRKKNIQKIKESVQTAKDVKSTGAESKKESASEDKKLNMRDFLKGKF